jgi:hypothetical protein
MTTATLLRSAAPRATGAGPLGWVTPARSAHLAVAGAAVSVPPIVLLHLDAPARLSAATTTISDYVVETPAGEPLFGLATGALALAGIAIARCLDGASAVRAMLAGWSLALILAAAFPTNLPGTPAGVSSTVHLMAGAVVFGLLPVVGLAVWRRCRSSIAGTRTGWALIITTAVSGVLSAALILNRIPAIVGLDQLSLPAGLLQRAAGAVEIVLAVIIALAALRVTPTRHGHTVELPRSAR